MRAFSAQVDVVAYDIEPPDSETLLNGFAYRPFCAVHRADSSLFAADPSLASRTLLIAWPGQHDAPSQNDASEGAPAGWEAGCLNSYIEAGGQQVVYVGEREEKVNGMPLLWTNRPRWPGVGLMTRAFCCGVRSCRWIATGRGRQREPAIPSAVAHQVCVGGPVGRAEPLLHVRRRHGVEAEVRSCVERWRTAEGLVSQLDFALPYIHQPGSSAGDRSTQP
jgi:hypothetical protein